MYMIKEKFQLCLKTFEERMKNSMHQNLFSSRKNQ